MTERDFKTRKTTSPEIEYAEMRKRALSVDEIVEEHCKNCPILENKSYNSEEIKCYYHKVSNINEHWREICKNLFASEVGRSQFAKEVEDIAMFTKTHNGQIKEIVIPISEWNKIKEGIN